MRYAVMVMLWLATACGSDFAGTWEGSVDGVATTMELKQDGTGLKGTVVASGYTYQMSGSIDGDSATGVLVDQNGMSLSYTAKRSGNDLAVSVASPMGGEQVFNFKRKGGGGAGAAPTPWGGAASESSPSGGGSPAQQRDQSLVGNWSRTEGMSSGGASFASQQLLRVNADGTFEQGAGRSAGGGEGWSVSSGEGTETVGRGKWHTEGNIVHVDGSPYARYYVEGNKLMFTFSDGTRQVWYRSN